MNYGDGYPLLNDIFIPENTATIDSDHQFQCVEGSFPTPPSHSQTPVLQFNSIRIYTTYLEITSDSTG